MDQTMAVLSASFSLIGALFLEQLLVSGGKRWSRVKILVNDNDSRQARGGAGENVSLMHAYAWSLCYLYFCLPDAHFSSKPDALPLN
jgi:hypothetical protein